MELARCAYHLTLRGRRILLLEQFQIGNNRGSSHGESRIIRYTHDSTDYARFMPQTFELRRRLEQENETSLLIDTGSLFAGPADSAFLDGCRDTLEFPYELLAGKDLAAVYPQIRVPTDWIGLFQPDAGILSATRCVTTLAVEAVKHGAVLRENTRVLSISPDRFPVFIIDLEPHCYGFPVWERPGAVKIALEQSERTVNPDEERQLDQRLLRELVDRVKTYLPAVIPEPISAEPCLCTETANRDFIVDRHPEHPQILFAAGFSGRGFKHTIALGKLLADLAAAPAGVYDGPFWLDNYRIERFCASYRPSGR